MQLAVALYNNDVDDEDELEFRKGDVLTVLIENPNGLNGWWLCERNGKCGLCPANRLKLASNVASSINSNVPSSFPVTESTYDSLSNDYDIPVTATSANHDYDVPQGSDFISNASTPTPVDSSSSPESSSRSSGIYSTVDVRLSDISSSSSSEFTTTNPTHSSSSPHCSSSSSSSIDIDQLQSGFRKLSIRSSLLDKYRQLITLSHQPNADLEAICRLFSTECTVFLHNYGCLLDRHTYKTIKEHLLVELERTSSRTQVVRLVTDILKILRPIIELRIKQKHDSLSSIPLDVFKKLNLEPIDELTGEMEQQQKKKMTTSWSTTQLYGNFKNQNHNNEKSVYRTRPLHMSTSKTYHSSFLPSASSTPFANTNRRKSDDYDYIDDDYSTSSSSMSTTDPLVKCYHRHIREHVASMATRHSHLCQLSRSQNDNNLSVLITEGKALIVAGHKLVFVLETLHEHLRKSTKISRNQSPLLLMTTQLCDALTSFVRLLKQLGSSTNGDSSLFAILMKTFEHDTQSIMNVAKRIKQQCNSV